MLSQALNHYGVAFVLVLARVTGIFLFAPIFSSKMIPMQIKGLAIVAISVAITPAVNPEKGLTGDAAMIVELMMKEVLVGLAFALALGAVMAAVSTAGSLLDTIVGFSFGALLDPITNVQAGVFGQFYSIFATMVFLTTGGDQLVLLGLGRTYDLIPLGAMPSMQNLAALATVGLAHIFIIGVEIAAPVMIALMLTDVAFALVSRAVPQMNVFQVGLPAKALVAFMTVGASLPFLSNRLEGLLQGSVMQALMAMKVA
jgi:flagellar biosynthetic protein FliR